MKLLIAITLALFGIVCTLEDGTEKDPLKDTRDIGRVIVPYLNKRNGLAANCTVDRVYRIFGRSVLDQNERYQTANGYASPWVGTYIANFEYSRCVFTATVTDDHECPERRAMNCTATFTTRDYPGRFYSDTNNVDSMVCYPIKEDSSEWKPLDPKSRESVDVNNLLVEDLKVKHGQSANVSMEVFDKVSRRVDRAYAKNDYHYLVNFIYSLCDANALITESVCRRINATCSAQVTLTFLSYHRREVKVSNQICKLN